MIGKTISHYQILKKLLTKSGQVGEDGMSSLIKKYNKLIPQTRDVLYKIADLKLKRTVALKFLPPELTIYPKARKRFIQEAQAASGLGEGGLGGVLLVAQQQPRQPHPGVHHRVPVVEAGVPEGARLDRLQVGHEALLPQGPPAAGAVMASAGGSPVTSMRQISSTLS